VDYLNIAACIPCTEAEGPGKRFSLWLQGCLQRCPGCCNPEMQEFVPRRIVSVDEVLQRIEQAAAMGIEGITLLGGEPMLQAKGLAVIARECRRRSLSVVVFSGYTLRQLQRDALPGVHELLAHSDILVDGPFIATMPDLTRCWVGSTNQRFHFLSGRYPSGIESAGPCRDVAELRRLPNGACVINGAPRMSHFLRS